MADTIEGTATQSLTEEQARDLLLRADPKRVNPSPQDIAAAQQAHEYVAGLLKNGSQQDIVAIAGQHGMDTQALQDVFQQIGGQAEEIHQRGAAAQQQEESLKLQLEGGKRKSLIGAAAGLALGMVGGYFFGKKAGAKWPDRSLPKWGVGIATSLAGLLAGAFTAFHFTIKPLAEQAGQLQLQQSQIGVDIENIGKASTAQLRQIQASLTAAVLADKLNQAQPAAMPEIPDQKRFSEAEGAAKSPLDHASRPPQERALA